MAEHAQDRVDNAVATVVKVIDDYSVVINRGSAHGVSKGDKYLVYYVEPDEIIDPESGESLGNLEVVRGTGTVVHVQEKIATLESNRVSKQSKIVRRIGGSGVRFAAGIAGLLGNETEEEIESPPQKIPFDSPDTGDRAKPI